MSEEETKQESPTRAKTRKEYDIRVTISLPNGMFGSVYVKQGENIDDAINKFLDNWWDVQKEMHPELFDEENPGKCPKCGGDLKLNKDRKGRNYYSCENYPSCRFWKFIKND